MEKKMDEIKKDESNTSRTIESKEPVNAITLTNFRYKRLLSDKKETKTVFLEGSFEGRPELAVLKLEKDSFQEEGLQKLFREENEIENSFSNDIYYSYRYHPKSDFNEIKVTLIYPATEKHILKYEHQTIHIVEESPELYHTVTLPFIKNEQFSLQWVYNILEHKSETDRIVFEDSNPETGFILCSDIEWDGKSVETLHLLALPFKRGIMSLRDLTQKCLPLLRNIYKKGLEAIEEKYSIPGTQLRVYIHYQPSFYHLHVHFTHLQYSAPGTSAERAHLLTTVINNLELVSNYYQISKLNFTLKESDNLFGKYESLGLLKPLSKK